MNYHGILAVVAAAAALLCLCLLMQRLRRDRVVTDTPAARIRSAAQGYVKIAGRAQPAGLDPMRAPLSGRSCVWWDYRIDCEERDSQGRHMSWRSSESAASVELFALEDDGARCLVGPVQAEVTPTLTNTWYGTTARPLGPPPALAPALHLGNWRYTERLIEPGAALSVLGELRSHSETGDINAATLAKLREWKRDQAALLARFDANHDGRIDAAEWDAVRQAALAEAQAQNIDSSIGRVSIISLPSGDEPFLIAPLSPLQLRHRERLYALLYLLLGLACVALCAWELQGAG